MVVYQCCYYTYGLLSQSEVLLGSLLRQLVIVEAIMPLMETLLLLPGKLSLHAENYLHRTVMCEVKSSVLLMDEFV